MWHEAKKQEKLIRGMIVDYRRRAERRRDFYEKIKADPTQFLQLHGRPCKIHLDPAIAAAGDSAAIMMPWQGDHESVIDRFDVRAHLDYIPDIKTPDLTADELSYEERNCNYERYRILAQNIFLGIGEEKFLHQLSVEEQFGVTLDEKELQKERQGEKKGSGAAIGYNYDESGHSSNTPDVASTSSTKAAAPTDEDKDDSDEESDLEMIDVDLSIDVNKVEPAQAHAMNTCGANFGMQGTDLFSFLTGDAQDAENQKQLLREEKEKALFSGRKSRRERRAHRDKKLALRVVSPPHYAAQASPLGKRRHSPSMSPTRSVSPVETFSNSITFITSFGGEDEAAIDTDKPVAKASYADKARMNATSKEKTYATVVRDGSRRRTKRSPSPRRSDWSPHQRQRSPPSRGGARPSTRPAAPRSRRRSRSWRSRSADSRSRSRSRSRGRSFTAAKDRRRRSMSSKRSRRSGSSSSRSSYRSRSMDSQYSSASSGRKRKYSHTAGNNSGNKESGVGTSGNNQNSTSDRIPKYYGRKREGCRSSSSELSIDSSDGQSNGTDKTNDTLAGSKTSQVSNLVHNSGAASKLSKSAQEKLSIKERLRKKMQAQLSRQLRADKKAEAERVEREQQLLQERDDEMRELAIRLRRRQREMRHQRRASESSADRDSSSSHSPRNNRSRSPPLPPEMNSGDTATQQEGGGSQQRTDKSKTSPWEQSPDQSKGNANQAERTSPRDADTQRFSDANRYNRPPPFVIRNSFNPANPPDTRGSFTNTRYPNDVNKNTEFAPRGRSDDGNRNNFSQGYNDNSNYRSDSNRNYRDNMDPRFNDNRFGNNRDSSYYNRNSGYNNNNNRGSYTNSRYSIDNRGRGFNNNIGNRNYDNKYQDNRKYGDSNDSQDKYKRDNSQSGDQRRRDGNSDSQGPGTSSSAKPFKRLVDY